MEEVLARKTAAIWLDELIETILTYLFPKGL